MTTQILIEDCRTIILTDGTQGPSGIQGNQGIQGIKGDQGIQGPGGINVVYAIADENLSGGKVVVMNENNKFIYADNTNVTHAGRIAGITTGAIMQNSDGMVIASGLLIEPVWAWNINEPIFLGLNGALTQIEPTIGFLQVIGVATSTTSMFINIREPIILV
jgi:hypothetical protein